MLEDINKYKKEIKEITEEIYSLQHKQSNLYTKIYQTISNNSNSFDELFNNISLCGYDIDDFGAIKSIVNLFNGRLQKENKILVFCGCKLLTLFTGMHESKTCKSDKIFLEESKNIKYIIPDIISYKNEFPTLEIGFRTGKVHKMRIAAKDITIFDDIDTATLYMECKD